MKKIKLSKSKKIKILKIVTAVIAGAGLLFLLYPSYTNIVGRVRQASVLSEWETKKEALQEEGKEPFEIDENYITPSEDIIEGDKIDKITEEPYSRDIGKEEIDYSILTAEDFFPLKIKIPKIELEWIVNEGADTVTLKQGPGHIPETPLPGIPEGPQFPVTGQLTGRLLIRLTGLRTAILSILRQLRGDFYLRCNRA